MAFASVGALGSANDKTAGTTIQMTVSAGAAAGSYVVVWAAFDNEATTDSQSSQLSISDSAGNTWTKLREQTETSGVADDGVCGAIFVSTLTNAMTSGVSTITVTSTSSRTASAIVAHNFSGSGATLAKGDGTSEAVVNAASGQPGAVATTGMTSREYLHLWGMFWEAAGTITITAADQMTQVALAGTTGGAGDTNITATGGYKISTTTGVSQDATASTGSQHVQILVAVYEAVTNKTITGVVATATATGLVATIANTGRTVAPGAAAATGAVASASKVASVTVGPSAASATASVTAPIRATVEGPKLPPAASATAAVATAGKIASVIVGPSPASATAAVTAPTRTGTGGLGATIIHVAARAQAQQGDSTAPVVWLETMNAPTIGVTPIAPAAAATADGISAALAPRIVVAPAAAAATTKANLPPSQAPPSPNAAASTASSVAPNPSLTIPVVTAAATAQVTAPVRPLVGSSIIAFATASSVGPAVKIAVVAVAATASASISIPNPYVTAPGPRTVVAARASAEASGLIVDGFSASPLFGPETTTTWSDLLREAKIPKDTDDVSVDTNRWLTGPRR